MNELIKLQQGLRNSNAMVYKMQQNKLACSFIKGGIVIDSLLIEDKILISALTKKGVNGILEGRSFETLKNTYDMFSLHVKSQRLFQQLKNPAVVELNPVPVYKEVYRENAVA
ncbi:hypothetical protein [Pontibacter vulgaris]|uniref:hypothetical protein n=1 Tax=Pontibacter vulgaris TaxID=2905679 RepID=UPI001FA6F02E|nr:hypothetical protein [Pontibacter vulgaris]